jgi:serine/threonine protein kinase
VDLDERRTDATMSPDRRRRLDFGPELPPELFAATTPRPAASSAAASGADDQIAPRFRRKPGRRREPGLLHRGSVIDKYRIEELLGVGGFGAVYKATHLLLHTKVAIKLLRPVVAMEQPDLNEQLLSEARYAARINHPNVVRILDVTRSKSIAYVVMEYIDGHSLSASIEKHGNILLTREGTAKIVDFGLARATRLSDIEAQSRTRMIVGTRDYMAPEQELQPASVDHRADIYGLGVTLFEALTGRLPFAARAPVQVRGWPPRTTHASPELARLLGEMLSPHALDRPASYDELLRRFQRLV